MYTLTQSVGTTKLDKPLNRSPYRLLIKQSYYRPLYSSSLRFIVINTHLQYVLKQNIKVGPCLDSGRAEGEGGKGLLHDLIEAEVYKHCA